MNAIKFPPAVILVCVLVFTAVTPLRAAENSEKDGESETAESAPTAAAIELGQLHIYGYFSVRLEKVYSEPGLVDGVTVKADAPAEWSLPFFHVMFQHRLGDQFKVFVNLNGAGGDSIDVRNMWGEYTGRDWFNVRVGKTYRKFGLYNEMLDAVPTYIGIEPPELFDADHLIVSRTTTLMGHGRASSGGMGNFSYSATTDNGEGDAVEGTIPMGFDFNYKFGGDAYTIGTSSYFSNGPTTPDVAVGDGPPRSGVLPWMAADEFRVFGAYFEARPRNLILQTAYWQAPHDAIRDPASVVAVVHNADLNPRQRARFLIDPNGPVTESNVDTLANYDVKTWYLRAGYAIESDYGQWTPYFLWDWYENPETIGSKAYGGDNEAGVADDGQFHKSTFGIVYRPVSEVAIKVDTSWHYFTFNGEDTSYPEVRFDFSFIFGQ